MTYTTWKRELQPGVRLFVENHRRPWLSRHVVVSSVTKRTLLVDDVEDTGYRARISLPAASFTSMKDNVCTILAQHDGPAFNMERQKLWLPLLAGSPLLSIELLQ
jgi:hypothetical protein